MTLLLSETFRPRPARIWQSIRTGGGELILHDGGLRLQITGASATRYADAQIDDYTGRARRAYPWRPPLRLTVQARFSGPIEGTAGFGFWNNPFSPLGGWPALPAAIWFFFASPPSDLPLAMSSRGAGWKAACLDATRRQALPWVALAGPVVLLGQLPALQRRIWPSVERALAIDEAILAGPDTGWHTYTLDWYPDAARFTVDGVTVLTTSQAPRGPLGFVAWVDNQWMVASPRGRLGWGLLPARPAWLDLALVRIESLEDGAWHSLC